jgi:glycine/D-amino acid oxidase-like deaminating enzyme
VKNPGITKVAVLEKGWLAGGNTTLIRSNYLWDESAQTYEHALKLWEGLEEDLGSPILFSQRGVLNLAHSLQDAQRHRRRVAGTRRGEKALPDRQHLIRPSLSDARGDVATARGNRQTRLRCLRFRALR